MSEFPKIENLYNTEKSDINPPEKIDTSLEKNKDEIGNKEKKEKLPHTIETNFKTNPDGTININAKLKNISKNYLPENLRNKESGEIKIILTDHDTIAKKMLNQLLETENKNE